MFINNYIFIFLLICINTTIIAQGNKEYFKSSGILDDEFDRNAWDRIKSLEKEIEAITYNNGNLQSQIYNLKNDISRFKNVYQSLLKSETELIAIRGELQTLKANYIALNGENETLKYKISELEEKLGRALNLLDEYKERVETQANTITNANLKAETATALAEARKEVINELIDEEAKENEVSLFNLYGGFGAGSSFSGIGMCTGIKVGYVQALGIRSGIGVLPLIYQTDGLYANLGLDIYLNEDIYFSSSYQKLIDGGNGKTFDHVITFTVGIDYTFRRNKGGGIKLGIGGIYLYTEGYKPESILSGDLGMFYKFQIGNRFRSL